MAYVPDYYTGAPASHPNNEKICDREDELKKLQAEYDGLTTDDVEWTEDGEERCKYLEERIRELKSSINYLNERE